MAIYRGPGPSNPAVPVSSNASRVEIVDSGEYYTSDNVEGALDEIGNQLGLGGGGSVITSGTIDGVSIGATTPATYLAVDQFTFDSRTMTLGGADILVDIAGTTTLSNIDALDATTIATMEAAMELNIDTLDGVSIGATTPATYLAVTGNTDLIGDLDVDNLNLNGNTIISTDVNGDINLTPNGTGQVVISKADINAGTFAGALDGSWSSSNGLEALTTAEVDQLEAIGTTTVSATQWGYLGAMDQGVATTDAPGFATGTTIGTLTLADGSITDSGGTISFGNEALTTTGTISGGSTITLGASDTTAGAAYLYGAGAGSDIGGGILLYTAADHDTTYNYFNLTINQDDFRIGTSANATAGAVWSPVSSTWNYGANAITTTGSLLVGLGSALTTTLTPQAQFSANGNNSGIGISYFASAAGGGSLSFLKSRNATEGSYTIVADDDLLGAIRWFGDDGVDYASRAAAIEAFVDGTPGAGDMPTRLEFSTTADGAEIETTRFQINANGTLVTGAATALGVEAGSLTVSTGDSGASSVQSDADDLVIENNASVGSTWLSATTGSINLFMGDSTSQTLGRIIYGASSHASLANTMSFYTAGTEAMRIDSSQRLLKGNTSSTPVVGVDGGLQIHANASGSGASMAIARYANDTSGPLFLFGKSRSGLPGTPGGATAGADAGDALGAIMWGVDDTVDLASNAGYIELKAEADSAVDSHTSFMRFATAGAGAGSERMRITSSGDVGIGATTVDARLHVQDTAGLIAKFENAAATVGYVQLFSQAGQNANIQFGDDTNGSFWTMGYNYNAGTDDFTLYNVQTTNTAIRISGANDDVRVGAGNLVIGTSGKGIDFSATSNGTGAGSVSELLNDYEQGTFTPVFADANTAGNTATGTISGIYTKVGRQVTVNIQGSNLVTTSMTAGNSLYIRGLPFATINNASLSVGTCTLNTVTVTGEYVVPRAIANTTYMVLREIRTGTTDIDIIVSDLSTGVSDMFITLTYTAADI